MNFGKPYMSLPLSQVIFEKFDKDKSGFIDNSEFQQCAFILGYALTDLDIQSLLKVLDADGNGKVDLNEFGKWWAISDRWSQLKLTDDDLNIRKISAETFNEYDDKHTGYVISEEFDAFYSDLVDQSLTKKSKDEFQQDLDAKAGKIHFKNYIDWLTKLGTLVRRE